MTNRWDLLLFIALVVVIFINTATTAASDDTDSQRFQGPIIYPNKRQVILQKGQNYTLTCKAKTPVAFKQQETPEEVTTINVTHRKEYIAEGEYKFKTVLELYKVDQYTVGYYACYDEQINVSKILNDLSEEPSNTEHISFIYIYVNGTDSLFAPMREIVKLKNNSKVVIECRPTTPEVQVTLKETAAIPDRYSPKIGFVFNNDALSTYTIFICVFKGPKKVTEITDVYLKQHIIPPPDPKISGGPKYFLQGESFSINCTIQYEGNLVTLTWIFPPNVEKGSIDEKSNEFISIDDDGILYKNITIRNATKDHAGEYVCMSTNKFHSKTAKFIKEYKDKPFLELSSVLDQPIEATQKKQRIPIHLDAYPPAEYHFLMNNRTLPANVLKYKVTKTQYNDVILEINNTEVTDTANYTLVATTRNLVKQYTIDYRRRAVPVIDFGPKVDKIYLENQKVTLQCIVIGYPPPNIIWVFTNGEKEQTLPSHSVTEESIYKAIATLVFPKVHTSGNITCKASNMMGMAIETRRLLVYEMEDGFGIKNRNAWFSENENVTVTCIASIYKFSSINWLGKAGEYLNETVEHTKNPLSLVATLKIPNIALSQSGEYTCQGVKFDGKQVEELIDITVAAVKPPSIVEPATDVIEKVYPCSGARCPPMMQLTCLVEGVPPPEVEWSKDDVVFKKNNSNVEIITNTINHTIVNSTITVKIMDDNYTGIYECSANSNGIIAKRTYSLLLEGKSYTLYLGVIIGIILILIIAVIYLTIKIRKEKQFRRELAAAGLLYFKEGVTKSLNPDLGIDEQAELLPYDEKFEFPAEKLILGKQLGAGAFGVVYKAEARGIINAEETTEVAVKMVKKTADNMYIKALASELKIMVHLGKHVNIVNLLGACTKNVGKRELSVIVEYCKFGNIHNYMQRHREVFIDQLTDNKEKNLGRINRGFSCSSGSTGMHSDYFGACNTQETDHTFINSANTNKSARKDNRNQQMEFVKVSEGYVQPEWRSNYESDYSFDGRNPRPLTSRDLLAWAFQIARGMEYLASRKVLHGDLAARNVLLAEDNIVKICDFGLARSIYKNDEYQKKENSLLPVKWLAIECMTDRIFSTQSDVWSFGIVLWELFSLAKTPYPNMEPAHLLSWLSEGKRLAKPTYSDDRIYDVMLKCWEQKPTARPTFSQLQEIIGGFLEDNVRNHYVDLNSAYMDMNAAPSGHEDYLIMMNAPDYNNLVTPSPHHYVNDVNFFPATPTQLDEDGYLKMNPRQNIFSPRPEDNKFDFDARKFNPKVSEASSCGSELTPMLTLNNLPARSGSESDHEGSTSPNIGMCPTIDEETDEVFEMKQNNIRNARMNTAVSNPTYITLDVDIEKKPNNFINSYINVPNGLVK